MLPTTVIGSYPQPDWLIDRERLRGSLPPRVRARELWRVDGALPRRRPRTTPPRSRSPTRSAPGVDIVTDGEIRRESYSNRFATALEGLDIDNPAMVPGRAGGTNAVPRVVGPGPAHAAGRGRRPALPARAHRPHDQDHAARPVHDEPAGLQRGLRRRGRAGDGPRRGGQRGGARPVRGGRRHRADRRAVAAVARREGARVRAPGDRPRARGRRRARPRCTPASATPTSSTTARPATRSSPSSPTAPRTCSRSRPPSRGSTRRCSSRSPARP